MASTAVDWRDRVLQSVTAVQESYIAGRSPGAVFDELLRHVLAITDSEYGYIGEVLEDEDGTPYLKAYAMTDISWDDASREIYRQAMEGGGFEFRNLQSLFGAVLVTGQPVIANDAPNDPRASGTMRGHLPLERFLGLPLHSEGELVGSVGVSNRVGGYDEELVAHLEPFLHTCGNLVRAFRERRLRDEAKREAASTGARLDAVLASVNEAILTLDADGVVTSANPAAARLFGLDPLGQRLSGLVAPAEVILVEAAMQEAAGLALRVGVVGDGGEVVPVDASFVRSTSDEASLVAVLRDATIAARAEEAMRRARDEAERLNRTKDDFVATMSHELRTPLNGVLGLSELLLQGTGGELSEKQEEFVGLIAQSGRHLLALINDVLDLAKVEAGRIELDRQPMRVEDALRDVVEMAEATAAAAGRSIEVEVADDLPVVRADRRRVSQVLLNLLSNACKFTPPPGRVGVRLLPEPGGGVVAEVWDEGIGIDPEGRARLFQPFEQVDSGLDRQRGGTGLGLALSRRLARAHGGDITLDSSPGEGSTFRLRLPLDGEWLGPRRRATDVSGDGTAA